MKFSVREHEFELLPGFWLAQIGWFVVNFTMGFLEVPWPNVFFQGAVTSVVAAISMYNVTIDGKGLLEIMMTTGDQIA